VPILADTVDGVIGVDTHRDTLAAAALSPVGGILAQTATRADATGYQQLLEFADTQTPSGPARRCWAVEGTGSDGAGLTAFLHTHGERVVEVARPKRPPVVPAPRPMRSMRSVRLGRPLATSTRRCRAAAATAKPCGCC
jgi:hypothetical protein